MNFTQIVPFGIYVLLVKCSLCLPTTPERMKHINRSNNHCHLPEANSVDEITNRTHLSMLLSIYLHNRLSQRPAATSHIIIAAHAVYIKTLKYCLLI